MTKKSPDIRPSAGEMEILRVLWRRGACTVREVWRELGPSRGTGYTTVLKLMQIMAQKGLVQRDERQRAHVYEAVVTESVAQRRVVADLLDRVFSGSPGQLVLRALETKPVSAQELAEIQTMLDNYGRKRR